jgi:hypothetical protein
MAFIQPCFDCDSAAVSADFEAALDFTLQACLWYDSRIA